MSILLSRRGIVVCITVGVCACADQEQRTEVAQAAPTQYSGSSVCETVSTFSKASFVAADRNNDGVIDEAEFVADAAGAFAGQDHDGDYQLTRAELPTAPAGSFETRDSDRSGTLTFPELMRTKAADFQRADINGDGVLSEIEVAQFNARQGGCT